MYLYPLLVVSCLLFVRVAHAVCPICVVAVGAGVGIAEEFGVDDVIIGLWIGALILAIGWWTINWLVKKNWCFRGCGPATLVSYYLLTIIPLYYSGFIGKTLNKIWGIDKLLLGIVLGSVLFYAGERLHFYFKAKNNDRVYFPFQKVAAPLAVLIAASLLFYFFNK